MLNQVLGWLMIRHSGLSTVINFDWWQLIPFVINLLTRYLVIWVNYSIIYHAGKIDCFCSVMLRYTGDYVKLILSHLSKK